MAGMSYVIIVKWILTKAKRGLVAYVFPLQIRFNAKDLVDTASHPESVKVVNRSDGNV